VSQHRGPDGEARLLLEGAVTADTVARILAEAGPRARGAEIVDFAAVTEADSAAVALALAWVREARAAGRTLQFANLPPAMTKLARLYAVADLVAVAPALTA
jgi:phospholipid transport system transporter-binding protein